LASKKDKLLENAQRFVLKGQIDRAIKEYQQIVALDPREIRFRQRLAELLVRDNRKEEAIAEYEDIGKHFADNSYFLKAIAVYKQIQRLDSGNADVAYTLAVLNQRQGLTGNALAEFNQTVRLLEQQGNLPRAVKVVKEMLALDADNSGAHLKHAELLYATGDREASYLAFGELLKRLVQSGADAAAEKVSGRMGELFPGRDDHELALLSLRMEKGDLEGALASVRHALARNERHLQGWRLLCDVLRRKGEKGEVLAALERMVELFPEDLSVLAEAVRAHLDSGSFALAADILLQHLGTFLAAGRAADVEPLFAALPAALRAEGEVQEGLVRVYEALGDWERLNALRAPVLQTPAAQPSRPSEPAAPAESIAPAEPAAAPEPAAVPAVESEQHLGWEEEIDLDFEDEPAGPAAEPPAPQALELEWPEEPGPFAPVDSAAGATEPEGADLPWGELETPAEPEPEAPAPHGEALDFLSADAPELELALPEEAPAPQAEWLPLELELPGEEAEVEEALPSEAAQPAPEAGGHPQGGDLTWDDVFPGCLAAEGTLDLAEAESHYDLGIAYMEMGRPDAALQEFAAAAANPNRRLDCLILEGMSYRTKGEEERAEELWRKGLQVGALTAQERVTLGYELASLYEDRGAVDLAVPLYREINAVDPSFRDVALKLSLLEGEEALDVIDLEVEEVL